MRRVRLPTTTIAVATSTRTKTMTLVIVKFQETMAPAGTCVLNRDGFQIVQRCAWLMLMPETSNPHHGSNAPIKEIAPTKMETTLILHEIGRKLLIQRNNP